jgi:hypothetical protein
MKLESIYKKKYLIINGLLEDKNKMVQNFIDFYINAEYYIKYDILLIWLHRHRDISIRNLFLPTIGKQNGVIEIVNCTDEIFDKFFEHAQAVVINSKSEGLDLNLFKALKMGKAIYINANHTLLRNKSKSILEKMNLSLIDVKNPKYEFHDKTVANIPNDFYSFFTQRDSIYSVTVEEIIEELRRTYP